MINQAVEKQVKSIVYDLNNCANEYGFKTEGWRLKAVTTTEKAELEKKYYPTISLKVVPEALTELLRAVNEKLVKSSSDYEKDRDTEDKGNLNFEYLVAFNPERVR